MHINSDKIRDEIFKHNYSLAINKLVEYLVELEDRFGKEFCSQDLLELIETSIKNYDYLLLADLVKYELSQNINEISEKKAYDE
jgi:ribonucleotide reductase beta subunit family protein with ferritin-like domain